MLIELRGYAERTTLGYWAARYLAEEVYGLQSPNTLDAKARDLAAFVRWFCDANGHGDVGTWLPRDTQAFVGHLVGLNRAPSTVNRQLATLRRFARWLYEQPDRVLAGMPTRGVSELVTDEADCKKLDARQVHRLFKAADELVDNETGKAQRPRRNRAILAVLYRTGLRISELVGLERQQYDGRYLINVARKGKSRSKGVYLAAACRRPLDDYLKNERPDDDPDGNAAALLLPAGGSGYLTRQRAAAILRHIAAHASAHGNPIHLHPHRLRHTFGALYRARTGSDTETAAALGHASLQYVGRYVRKSKKEREADYESIEA